MAAASTRPPLICAQTETAASRRRRSSTSSHVGGASRASLRLDGARPPLLRAPELGLDGRELDRDRVDRGGGGGAGADARRAGRHHRARGVLRGAAGRGERRHGGEDVLGPGERRGGGRRERAAGDGVLRRWDAVVDARGRDQGDSGKPAGGVRAGGGRRGERGDGSGDVRRGKVEGVSRGGGEPRVAGGAEFRRWSAATRGTVARRASGGGGDRYASAVRGAEMERGFDQRLTGRGREDVEDVARARDRGGGRSRLGV